MRYALYNRSRRVLFIVVLGFVIEHAVTSFGTLIRITIFIGQPFVGTLWRLIANFFFPSQ